MSPRIAFLVYEMRRHLPVVATGWLVLLTVSGIHYLELFPPEQWQGVVLPVVVSALLLCMPFLLAISGWAKERSQETLRWLYARPLSAQQLFGLRTLAAALALTLWLFGTYWLYIAELKAAQGLGWPVNFSDLPLLILFQYYFTAIGILVSSLASSPLRATATAISGYIAFMFTLAGLIRILPKPDLPPSSISPPITLSLLSITCFFASWNAVRYSPDDRQRLTRAGVTAGIGLVAVLALTLLVDRV